MRLRSDKTPWALALPAGEPDKDELARCVAVGVDDAETEYYEAAADPTYVHLEQEQRRYRGMFRRRLRHLANKKR